MALENDFLPFAVGPGANVIAQQTYASLAALSSGFQAGIASSAQLNKVWRQTSIMAAVLAQFIVDQSGQPAIDDGATATLKANLLAAVQAAAQAVALTQSAADSRYAKLAGSSSQVFNVANATQASQAVALGQFTNNKSATGWMQRPDGFIEQWGQGSTDGTGKIVVTFPITFPNAVLDIQVTNVASGAPTAFPGAGGPSTTGMTIYAATATGTAAPAGAAFQWRVIGY